MFSATKPPSVNIWQADRVDFYKSVFHRYLLSLCNVSFALYLRDASIFQLKNVLLEMQNSPKLNKSKLILTCMKWVPGNPRTIFLVIFFYKTV